MGGYGGPSGPHILGRKRTGIGRVWNQWALGAPQVWDLLALVVSGPGGQRFASLVVLCVSKVPDLAPHNACPLRIGIITLWNARCEPSDYAAGLASALGSQGHQVVVLSSYPVQTNPGGSDGALVYRFFDTCQHDTSRMDVSVARQALVTHRIQLLHLHYHAFVYPQAFVSGLKTLRGQLPLVVTLHDAGVPLALKTLRPDAVVFTSERCRRQARHLGINGIVIPPGFRQCRPQPGAEARLALGIPGGPVLCLLSQSKGECQAALDLIGVLQERYPHITCLVLTNQRTSRSLKAPARRLGSRVRLITGCLPREALLQYCCSADVVLCSGAGVGPLDRGDGLIRLAVESLRPVVICDGVRRSAELSLLPAIPIRDTAAVASRVERILSDPGYAGTLTALNRALVAALNWTTIAHRHVGLYRALLPA